MASCERRSTQRGRNKPYLSRSCVALTSVLARLASLSSSVCLSAWQCLAVPASLSVPHDNVPRVKATAQDSALRVEMSALEDQADDGKARELHWKPLSWLTHPPPMDRCTHCCTQKDQCLPLTIC